MEMNKRPMASSPLSFGGDIYDQEIDKYLKSLKRRAQVSNRVGGSSMEDSHLQLWMLPVPVRSFYHIY